jgi:hypothetical protein
LSPTRIASADSVVSALVSRPCPPGERDTRTVWQKHGQPGEGLSFDQHYAQPVPPAAVHLFEVASEGGAFLLVLGGQFQRQLATQIFGLLARLRNLSLRGAHLFGRVLRLLAGVVRAPRRHDEGDKRNHG